ncbi:MAG: DUF362 domain-containing protein [Geobacteraceae bacterium]|nr:DUF362 domain-containing protein [Geobacteraceae bacterium]
MDLVSLQSCDHYDEALLKERLVALLEPMGGIRRFVSPGQRVLLKPNLLAGKPPEAAVTTHPALVKAVIELVQLAGAQVLVGDSPGLGSFERVAEKTGISQAVKATGGQLLPFGETRRVGTAGTFRQLELATAYLDADVVINLPKLKTHEMMTLTCAVKNLYGTVVGAAKAGLHLTAGHSKELFAGLLLEIAFARPVALTIVDGIVAMEGDGPNSGTPRQLGVLLAGENPVAIDTVAAYLAGIPPSLLPVELEARRRGLPGTELDQISVVGNMLLEAVTPPFVLPQGLDAQFGLPGFLKGLLRNQLSPVPVADKERCTLCGVCRDACPPEAITITKNALKVDSGRCIRCWCCRELCPQHAMEVQRGLLLRMLDRLR